MDLQLGVNECSNEDYHKNKTFLSSSDLKTILKSPELFYNDKILGLKENKSGEHFAIGSAVHSLLLEPHLFNSEFAIFDGMVKRGKEFEAFKSQNTKPYIISKPQHEQIKRLVSGCKKSKLAVELLSGGLSEHTVCQIYKDVPIKVRTDKINLEKNFILDIKTSAFSVDHDSFKTTINQWDYALSAALYLAIIEQFYGRKFEFYFLAISKQDATCAIYKLSESSRFSGQNRIDNAIKTYKKCKESGIWKADNSKFEPSEEILEV